MRIPKFHFANSKQVSTSRIEAFAAPELASGRWNLSEACNLEVGAFLACAVCGGAHSTSPLAQGMNWGIFTLMAFIGTVLGCIALFFVHIVRKEEAANKLPPQDRSADL